MGHDGIIFPKGTAGQEYPTTLVLQLQPVYNGSMFTPAYCTAPDCHGLSLGGGVFCIEHEPHTDLVTNTVRTKLLENDYFDSENFFGINLEGLTLKGKVFFRCCFSETRITDCDFSEAEIDLCWFDYTEIRNTRFRNLKGKGNVFAGAVMEKADFSGSDLVNNNFNGCQITDCNFNETDLYHSRYINSNLDKVTFIDCNLNRVDFSGITQKGVSFHNSNTEEAYFTMETE
jgi:uncharacterized protein YjbI with pentapeptide repeats